MLFGPRQKEPHHVAELAGHSPQHEKRACSFREWAELLRKAASLLELF